LKSKIANPRYLLFRADATISIGTGHVMRCLALAQTWKILNGKAIFIAYCENDVLKQRIEDEGFEVIRLNAIHPDPKDWTTTSKVLASHPDTWVVLDGYHFDCRYHQGIKELNHPLCVIDDMAHLKHYCADILINQNLNAKNLLYRSVEPANQLLGSDYAILRKEFLYYRDWQKSIPDKAKNILITFGGSDPYNVTCRILETFIRLDDAELNLIIVVGSGNPHLQKIKNILHALPGTCSLACNPDNMAELMAWADLAVSASGSTSWELAFMGLPSFMIVTSENQEPVARELQVMGVSQNLGWHTELTETETARTLIALILDRQKRQEMSCRGRKLVDGKGTEKILGRILIGRND
jgi:UDP-2,4-diacetamido-2,4,6-trideoxy-beta-L-altropyranose hydrolase